MSTFDRVSRVIQDTWDVDAAEVVPQARLYEDLCTDSLGMMQLVMALEDDLGVHVDDDEAEGIRTVQQLVDVIDARLRSIAA